MNRQRLPYVLASLFLLSLVSWLSVRAYDGMIGQIYYGAGRGFLASVFRRGQEEPAADSRSRAAVLYSNLTAKAAADRSAYGARVVSWRRALSRQGLSNDVIGDKSLTADGLRPYGLLVLPLATVLSDEQVAAIEDFAAQPGKGLILSGDAGAARENGDWREISLACEIAGAQDIQEAAAPGASAVSMTLDGDNALSANLPPGLRLDVGAYDHPVSARIVEPRARAAGLWRASGPDQAPAASLALGRYGQGKFVWSGFTLGSAVDPFGVKAGETLARNMVAYASFQPVFAKQPWPDDKRAAVALALNLGGDPRAAQAVQAMLARKRVPGTFFVTAEGARADPDGLKVLLGDPQFEIGLRGPASAPSLLKEETARLRGLGLGSVAGFEPDRPWKEDAALRALLDAGYSYFASPAPGGPPEIAQAGRPPLLSFGRNLTLLMRLPEAAPKPGPLVLEDLERDFDAAYRAGGFYCLALDSSSWQDAAQVRVIGRFLDYVKSKNVWLANLGQVAGWSSRWALVDVDSARGGPLRSNLIVSNSAAGEIDSLGLKAYFPEAPGPVQAKSEKLGGAIEVVAQRDDQAVFRIRHLSGEGLVYFIDSGSDP